MEVSASGEAEQAEAVKAEAQQATANAQVAFFGTQIDEIIAQYDVVLFAKSWCTYCHTTVPLLTSLKLSTSFKVHSVPCSPVFIPCV